MATARPCLVAHDLRSEEISSQSLGSLVNPMNTDERKEVEISSWEQHAILFKSRSRIFSSESTRYMFQQQLETPSGRINWKHTVMSEYSNSNCTRRHVASTPELRNMEYTKHSIHEQDLLVLAKETGKVIKRRNVVSVSLQNKCIEMWNAHGFVDESRHSSWAGLLGEFGDLHEHKIRGD